MQPARRNGLRIRLNVLVSMMLYAAAVPLLSAQETPGLGDNERLPGFREGTDTDKYALIITGPGATPEIGDRFSRWSASLYETLRQDYAYPEGHLLLLFGDGENTGEAVGLVDGDSRKESVRQTLSRLQERVSEGDQLSVYLIGHGSSRFGEAKFNNVGPDMTGEEFASMLEEFSEQDLLVVNTSSASFDFSARLAAPGRVVVSATRSSAERYDPMFVRYWIEALRGREADLDRNGRVSVLEAFNHASNSVAAWYEEEGRLATEHAVLDDNGDAMFAREPESSEADGTLAGIAYVGPMPVPEEKDSPEAAELLADMQTLEREVFVLRSRKDEYLESEYWDTLEELLVELARKTRRYNELP